MVIVNTWENYLYTGYLYMHYTRYTSTILLLVIKMILLMVNEWCQKRLIVCFNLNLRFIYLNLELSFINY